ncbi:hypothetical protein ACVMBY_007012 [Bradyrhizobium huanghuaihaiense]
MVAPPVPAEDWLCAANNAFIVSGEICGYLPALTDEVVPLVVLLPLSIANGLVGALCEAPVFCVDDDDFEFVSDWIASSALETAPRANNIAQLQPMRHAAANVLQLKSASVVPARKVQ